YWIDQYKRAGLKNVIELLREPRVELVKVESDRHYDAITVRIFASCHDYTVRTASGEIVGGSRSAARVFTEYWTFIRATGATSAPRPSDVGPSCGSSLEKISMSGICGACGSKLTSGRFDWVASRIEQDES